MATLRDPYAPLAQPENPLEQPWAQPAQSSTEPKPVAAAPAPPPVPKFNFGTQGDSGMEAGSGEPPPPPYTPPPPPTTPQPPTPPTPPATPPSGHQETVLSRWAQPQLASAYQKYLGRSISDGELWGYLGPNASEATIKQVLEAVRTSPESVAWQQSHPTQWGHEPAASTTPTNTATATTNPTNPGAPLSGFDANKWSDPNYHSTKYDIGHILAKYPSTPAGLQQAKAEIEATGLGKVTGKDIVTLKDGTIVDVGMGFSEGGGPNNWWWGVQSGPGGQVAPTGQGNATPTSVGGGGFPSPGPVPQWTGGGMGSEIDKTLSAIMSGKMTSTTGQAGRTALENFLKTGGNSQNRLESIREKMGMLTRAQMNDARGELASRGLLSEGSNSQGPEMSTLGRIEANLTPQWTAAARDALTAGDAQLIQAATVATGLDQQDIALMLSGANSASQREQMLATLAAKSLDQNMAWNEFLANYGLNRDQIMYAIQHGQVTSILPLIQNFFDASNTAGAGAN